MIHKSYGRDSGWCGASLLIDVVQKSITAAILQQIIKTDVALVHQILLLLNYNRLSLHTAILLEQIINTAVALLLIVHPISLLLHCSRLFNTASCNETQQSCTQCTEPVSATQHVPSPIHRGGRDGAAEVSPFKRPHAKHIRTELPPTRLRFSSFPHVPLGPLDLPVHFFK